MPFASGKYAYRISDRSGFRYRLKDTRKEWLDSYVRFTNDETETVINDMEVFREDVFSNKETFKEYLKYD